LRRHRSVSDIVGGDADSPYLQRLRINADVQLAPLAPTLRPMLFAFPLAFSQEFNACGVNQQVQAGCARAVRHLHIQTALAATQRAEVGDRPHQSRQRQ